MESFAPVTTGRERWDAHVRVPRHRHNGAYAAVVLTGGYEESGSCGRFRVGPGDVLLHNAFDAHLDCFAAGGADILNLTLSGPNLPRFRLGRVGDADTIARTAERDTTAASAELLQQMSEASCAHEDWQDILADALLHDPKCRLDDWAEAHGLAAETVSRGFGKVFGIAPAAFRAESRTRNAFEQIVGSTIPLAAIAASTGFADQAHMSRSVRTLTGMPPARWRRSNSFKTA